VFDKFLILRALKPQFPKALFFTNDFDSLLTNQSELDFTRNLLIVSSFGARLAAKIQGDIPPFRDTYVTSAFLATQLAVLDAKNDSESRWKSPPARRQDSIRRWFDQARVFEIARTGDIVPLTGRAKADENCKFSSQANAETSAIIQ
jgi:hypothetical protein